MGESSTTRTVACDTAGDASLAGLSLRGAARAETSEVVEQQRVFGVQLVHLPARAGEITRATAPLEVLRELERAASAPMVGRALQRVRRPREERGVALRVGCAEVLEPARRL